MKCIFTKNLEVPTLPNGLAGMDVIDSLDTLCFPETTMSMIQQREFNKHDYDEAIVITNSPFIVACFHAVDVLVERDDGGLEAPIEETYGAGFDVLMKQLNGIKSMIPQVVVEEIRAHLDMGDSNALAYLEHIGLSMEKAYLLRKLQPNK